MQADDFYNAYQVLREHNESLIDRLSKSSSNPSAETILSARPSMGVDIVCLAFSVELYIKDLHFVLKGEAPRGHDILELFKKLPENIRQKILDHDSISQNPFIYSGPMFSPKKYDGDYRPYDGFIDYIKTISDSFVTCGGAIPMKAQASNMRAGLF